MTFTGRISDGGYDLSGKARITFTLNEKNVSELDELLDKELTVTVKQYRRRRSLDQNALAWVYIDKIAQKIKRSPVEVYREEIRHIPGTSDMVCVREAGAEKLRESWSRNGLGWVTETMPSKVEGCVNVKLYYGSSTFDTKQMSDFIDRITEDCREFGIDATTLREASILEEHT